MASSAPSSSSSSPLPGPAAPVMTPFPGDRMRFVHTTGDWAVFNSNPEPNVLCRRMDFQSDPRGTVLTQFSLLGYAGGHMSICIYFNEHVDESEVAAYFRQFDVLLRWDDIRYGYKTQTLDELRVVFNILAENHDIPSDVTKKIKWLINGNSTSSSISSARKDDTDKPRMDLLPSLALEQIALVLGFGAKKYSENNWRRGMKWSRLLGALLRHLHAWSQGEDNDNESGLSHLGHAGCCLAFLIEYGKWYKEGDDRVCGRVPGGPVDPVCARPFDENESAYISGEIWRLQQWQDLYRFCKLAEQGHPSVQGNPAATLIRSQLRESSSSDRKEGESVSDSSQTPNAHSQG